MTETVVVTPVVVVPLRTRISMHLRNWGAKIKTGLAKIGSWFVNGAKWLISTRPIKWVVAKAKFVAGWVGFRGAVAWHYVKRPLLWIGLPALAFWTMPTTATVLLAVGVLALASSTYFAYRSYKHLRTISTKEELIELVDRVTEYDPAPTAHGNELIFEEDVLPGETPENRLVFLDQQLNMAQQNADANMYSEIVARMNLLNVRRDKVDGMRKNANLTTIHQAFRKEMERDYPTFDWNWDLMYRGTLSENRRLKELEKLQAKGGLTPVK